MMNWTNDDAENKRIYEESLRPDGMKKTEKINNRKLSAREYAQQAELKYMQKKEKRPIKTDAITKQQQMKNNITTIISFAIIIIVLVILILG